MEPEVAVYLAFSQLDDLEWRDQLHAGRAACRYGFAALNLGLIIAKDVDHARGKHSSVH